MSEPYGGYAVHDVAVTAAAAVHRDLTDGMYWSPAVTLGYDYGYSLSASVDRFVDRRFT